MAGQHLPSLSVRDKSYELAYRLAHKQLLHLDVAEVCRKTGAQYVTVSSKVIERPVIRMLVQYMSQPCVVTLPDGEICLQGSGEGLSPKDKILILHYLTTAKGSPATSRLITFGQLPGCASYVAVFQQLAVAPILARFGDQPELLLEAAAKLGGQKANYGDVSVIINAFSRVPVIIALWRGDDEFPPRGSIMFDSGISDYLPTEDIREICGIIARKLVKSVPPL
jgi:hypothetical protein